MSKRDADDEIHLRSHVARDLLQSAGLFKTDRTVVWEYVSNGLQYVDMATNPIVRVRLDNNKKAITVADKRGMDWEGIKNFFIMHGENVDRKAGSGGRGRFGTGKSAAFGIGRALRLTTTKDGKRSKVELTRADIDAMDSEAPIPIRVIERETPTDAPNGTVIEIGEVQLKKLDPGAVTSYIEKHLAKWHKNATVYVNQRECEFTEPPVDRIESFESGDDLLQGITLQVKVAKVPLDEDLRGVSVFANEVWYETALAGNEGRDMAQYLFGEIDVPGLDSNTQLPPPFDMSRSMKLNPENPLVAAIHAFIGQKVDEVRRTLVAEANERKKTEEARRLQEQAAEIAKVLNDDFDDFRRRLARVKAVTGSGTDLAEATESDEGDDFLVPGDEVGAVTVYPEQSDVATTTHGKKPELQPDDDGAPKAKSAEGTSDGKQRPRGGFSVEFDNQGEESPRAKYERDSRTIYINLDHPQLAAAKGLGGTDEASFQRLSYEVAFTEYAIALASEMAQRDEFIDFVEPVQEVREAINRLARKAAVLYAS